MPLTDEALAAALTRADIPCTGLSARTPSPPRTSAGPPPRGCAGSWSAQAYAGQVLPLAKAPDDVPERDPGVESPYAGRASFCRCEYGPYLIAMNTTTNSSYTLSTKGFGAATDLVTGAKVGGNTDLCV
ncbi:hypothetical protein ACWD4G_42265 [Streptomyces sp. NPDC002643]